MKTKKLNIEGFRSLRSVSWYPGDLNVIIGPNGTGKSNLLRFLELISVSAQGKLGKYVQSLGGMEPIVWDGIAVSIKFSLETTPEGGESGPETYDLELARLGPGSSYKVEKELLTNSHKLRKGIEKRPMIFLERAGRHAFIFDETERKFTTPEEFVADEESLLSIASGPFINNRFIPPFRRGLASIAVYHDLHTNPHARGAQRSMKIPPCPPLAKGGWGDFHINKNASIRQPAIARMERRVDPDGQNLISVMHTLYTGDRDFKAEKFE